MMVDEERAIRVHEERFGPREQMFQAPARVNLIGEHTDYTGGLVMPMAIEFQTMAILSSRADKRAVFYSDNYQEEISVELELLGRSPRGHWSDYPVGVLWVLQQEGIFPGGFSMTLSGDVPLGAGLSSSASVQVATALALLKHAGVDLSLERLANVCRRAENEYVGAKTGIMDQFVVAGAVAHRAMLLDCRSMTFELLPLPADVRVVICNSMVKHQLANGEYGDRRDEVESGQAVLQRERPGVTLLRDATVADLEACADKMTSASLARCRHIITENSRVLEAREALLQADMERFGSLMRTAHASFRDDFGASCEEVDTLVEIASRQPGCFGARITGGGFGGCTVNLVSAAVAEEFVAALRSEYERSTGILAECFVCTPSDGALAVIAKKNGQK